MQVSPPTPAATPTEAEQFAPKHGQVSVTQQQTPVKDTVVISEKAKDLAALQAGKAAVEEVHESLSAKAMEAPMA